MNVLAVSAHPDDETLGCGGTLLRHRAAGDAVSWLTVTQAYEPRWTAETVARKAAEVELVAQAYGIAKRYGLGLPAARLDTVPQEELIKGIGEAIEDAAPEVVYLVHGGDVHGDHRAVFDAAAPVLKPFHLARLGVRRVLSYETLSSTDAAPSSAFTPNVYCDITEHMDRKIEIMEMYETELQPEPLPRAASAIRALARYRGSTVGVEYAEAFELVWERL